MIVSSSIIFFSKRFEFNFRLISKIMALLWPFSIPFGFLETMFAVGQKLLFLFFNNHYL